MQVILNEQEYDDYLLLKSQRDTRIAKAGEMAAKSLRQIAERVPNTFYCTGKELKELIEQAAESVSQKGV